MSRAFQTDEEAEEFVREYLELGVGEAASFTCREEVPTDLEDVHAQLYDDIKEYKKNVESMTMDDASDIMWAIQWRDAIWQLGSARVAAIAAECLPASVETEYEALIRSVGPGYHPDTPFGGYEPPITHYTEEEWTRIHDAALEGIDDVYAFGLPIIQEMLEARVTKYRDGSRSDQVVIEEVEDMLDRYGTETDYVLLEVITWSDAARAKFQERFRERWPYS